jgi:hypothetical protein
MATPSSPVTSTPRPDARRGGGGSGCAKLRLAVVGFRAGFEQVQLRSTLLADWGRLAFVFVKERAGALGHWPVR